MSREIAMLTNSDYVYNRVTKIRFYEKMLLLYNNNFFSMGGFKALLGKEFYSSLENYMNSLVQFLSY